MEEIKNKIIELRNDINLKWKQYLIAEEALISEPLFIDKRINDAFLKARREWQVAVNNHNEYLKYLANEKGLNSNKEV